MKPKDILSELKSGDNSKEHMGWIGRNASDDSEDLALMDDLSQRQIAANMWAVSGQISRATLTEQMRRQRGF